MQKIKLSQHNKVQHLVSNFDTSKVKTNLL